MAKSKLTEAAQQSEGGTLQGYCMTPKKTPLRNVSESKHDIFFLVLTQQGRVLGEYLVTRRGILEKKRSDISVKQELKGMIKIEGIPTDITIWYDSVSYFGRYEIRLPKESLVA